MLINQEGESVKKKDSKGNIVKFPPKNNKSRKRLSLMPIISLFLAAVIFILVISGLRSFFITRFVSIDAANEQSYQQTLDDLPITLIREEKIITAPTSGKVTKQVDEGTRVKKGQTVMSYDNTSAKETTSNDTEKIGQELDRLNQDLLNELTKIRKGLNVQADPRNKLTKLQDSLKQLEQIENQHDDGEDNEEKARNKDIQAPVPGIISYQIDGYEDKINDTDQITTERLQQYRNIYQDKNVPDNAVVTRAPLFKLIEDFSWKTLIEVPEENIDELIDREQLDMDFDFSEQDFLSGEVKNVNEFDSCSILVVEFDHEEPEFWKQRFSTADIVYQDKTGFKLSESALTEQDGDKGVFIVERGVVSFEPIESTYEIDNDRVLVKGLEDGDLVIQNTFLVREGDRIR